MDCLVTGVAGFIGSSLSFKLMEKGYSVIGIDSFTDFYPRWIKEKNLKPLLKQDKFEFIEKDIAEIELVELIKRVDVVFHLAAQAGVRTSWGKNFSLYTRNNIEVTQKLLEAVKEAGIEKFIFASSSSVYGYCPELPMSEISPVYPYSPYGVTKLAAENLCFLYFKNYSIPIISLRYFTVYGAGQRPDMAFHKFFKAMLRGEKITIFGDGKQTRDFTYIDDIIEANIAALHKGKVGEIYNIGGGHRKKLEDLFPLLEKVSQEKVKIKWEEKQKGDMPHTLANIDKAQKDLGYYPQTDIEEGLRKEWLWIKELYSIKPSQGVRPDE